MVVDLQLLKLRHISKKEALGLISLMEERWDELLLFDPSAYSLQGSIATDRSSTIIWCKRGGTKGSSKEAYGNKYSQKSPPWLCKRMQTEEHRELLEG